MSSAGFYTTSIKVYRIFKHFPRTVLLSRAATGPDALAVRSVHSLLLLRGVDAQLTPSSSTRKFVDNFLLTTTVVTFICRAMPTSSERDDDF